jgi:hypothetical protein
VSRCRAQLDDAQGSHQALVNAVHLLEEAADHFERIGQRERSFDSYQVLIAVGRQSDQFEHMLEGYVNAIRILRQDALRYYALQSYEDVLREAQERAEFTAGASLAQEMAGYAASESMHSIANYAVGKQAAMWREVARASLQRGAPAEIAENAILAAIVALAKQGQFAEVGTLYAELGQLDLEPARQKHYSRASQRYQGVSNQPLDASPLPAHLRQDTEFPDVWHVDLVEHEQAGSASAACGDVVLQPDSWSDSTRRRAMLARLVALDIDAAQGSATAAQLVRLAQTLSQVELYTILSPLEALYRSPTSEVRLAVIQALERFMYKRSFVTVRGALSDDTAGVRQQAYRTVEALRFPHAFEPLARIVRESNDARARTAALSAIGRIDTADAAELLLGVFQHEGQKERQAAADALKRARGSTFFDAAKQAFPTLPKDAQRAIREVFQARGESL